MPRRTIPYALATVLAVGCGHNSDLVLRLKHQTPPASACAVAVAVAGAGAGELATRGIGTIAVLPFRASTKDGARQWKGPDGKEREEVVYPFADDGQRFAGLLQAALAATRTYHVVEPDQISEVVQGMGLGDAIANNTEVARQVAQVVGADAVVIGRIDAYRGELRHATIADEDEYIALYRGAVHVTGTVLQAGSGSVIARCQKGGNSQTFLDKDYAVTLDSIEEGDVWAKASHGKDVSDKVAYVATQIAAEMAKELTAGLPVREEEAPAAADGDVGADGGEGTASSGAESHPDGANESSGEGDDAAARETGDDARDAKADTGTQTDTDAGGEESAPDETGDAPEGGGKNDGEPTKDDGDAGDWREKMRQRQPKARPGP